MEHNTRTTRNRKGRLKCHTMEGATRKWSYLNETIYKWKSFKGTEGQAFTVQRCGKMGQQDQEHDTTTNSLFCGSFNGTWLTDMLHTKSRFTVTGVNWATRKKTLQDTNLGYYCRALWGIGHEKQRAWWKPPEVAKVGEAYNDQNKCPKSKPPCNNPNSKKMSHCWKIKFRNSLISLYLPLQNSLSYCNWINLLTVH